MAAIIDAKLERIPDDATWIDLEEPTNEEERLVERCIRVDVPTAGRNGRDRAVEPPL